MIYAVNTAVWLGELGCTLAEVPERELERLARFESVWLIGVWERSAFSASPYAVHRFVVEERFGGEAALRTFREKLQAKLILDFVPNHLALDHPWVTEHPERFVHVDGRIAHGRDPYFPPWTDTVQVDHRRRDTREAMTGELRRISELCDGVRCDMAMLVLRDVFLRTWNGEWDGDEFWPAAIAAVREDFVFIAEAYWGLEPALIEMGFDYAYDKTLYDELLHGKPEIRAGEHWVRFVENHDEERAATAFQPPEKHRAAATIALSAPGLPLIHDGQLEGRRVRIPIQAVRRPPEEPDRALADFYERLLHANPQGAFELLEVERAWDGNESHGAIVAFTRGDALVIANYADHQSQGYVRLTDPELAGRSWVLRDVLHDLEYERNGNELLARGLYLDIGPWFQHYFTRR